MQVMLIMMYLYSVWLSIKDFLIKKKTKQKKNKECVAISFQV